MFPKKKYHSVFAVLMRTVRQHLPLDAFALLLRYSAASPAPFGAT
jgi:hypothetical protein